MAKVSVVIPIYNVGRYVRRCIESVMAQTLQDIQIILVDDGSTDGSGMICDEYAAADKRIVVIHKPNGGVVSARKAGLEAACAPYVGFVDGDDWVEDDFFGYMHDLITKYQVAFVETGISYHYPQKVKKVVSWFEEGCYKGVDYKSVIIPKAMHCPENSSAYCAGIYHPMWCKLFETELMRECHAQIGDGDVMTEDMAATFQYLSLVDSVYISKKCMYNYNKENPGSINESINYAFSNMICNNYLVVKRALEKSKYRATLENELDYHLVRALITNAPWVFDTEGENASVFGGVSKNERVVLYGAGIKGRLMHKWLDGRVNVVAWVDKDYERMDESLGVASPEILKDIEYDKILICVMMNMDVVADIKANLLKSGVDERKICWIKPECFENTGEMLKKIGLE